LNNYTKDELKSLNELFSSNSSYILAEEVGESGTPHLQCYFSFNVKQRFTQVKKMMEKAHWEKAKGNTKDNLFYCMKEDGIKHGSLVPEVINSFPPVPELEFLYEKMRDYNFPIGDRKINVIVDEFGNLGKTEFCRYAVMTLDRCIVSGGKSADMKNQIVEFIKNNDGKCPKYILIDVPRSQVNWISYSGIEEVKNMLFYSGKYEGGMVNGNKPCVVMFMNQMPDTDAVSTDRWDIWEVRKGSKLRIKKKIVSTQNGCVGAST